MLVLLAVSFTPYSAGIGIQCVFSGSSSITFVIAGTTSASECTQATSLVVSKEKPQACLADAFDPSTSDCFISMTAPGVTGADWAAGISADALIVCDSSTTAIAAKQKFPVCVPGTYSSAQGITVAAALAGMAGLAAVLVV